MLLQISERDDPDGARRLALTGELDLASAPQLRERLGDLREAYRTVRLDLSQLQFIDSTGINLIVQGLGDSARDGWKLEVDPNVSRQVESVITMTGLARTLWPEARDSHSETAMSDDEGSAAAQHIRLMLRDGQSFEQAVRFINDLPIPREQRVALWLYARDEKDNVSMGPQAWSR